jgi:hypothetical protein
MARGRVLVSGTWRAATRGGGPVIERQQCEAASAEKLAAKLERSPNGWKSTRRT